MPDDDSRWEDADTYPITRVGMNPLVCTHALMSATDGRGESDDHDHDVLRHWELDTMPGWELLDLCAEIFSELDKLVGMAHAAVGQSLTS